MTFLSFINKHKQEQIDELTQLQLNEKLTGNNASIIFMYDDMIMDIELEGYITRFAKWLFPQEVFD